MKALYFILGLFSREAPGKVKEQKALTEKALTEKALTEKELTEKELTEKELTEKELTEKELTEKEALEILENTDCPFLKHAYTYISKANEAGSERERIRRLALAESAVEKSKALYSAMGAEIPEKYLSAVQTLLLEFEKRKKARQDLATAYRLAIQDGSADPLL